MSTAGLAFQLFVQMTTLFERHQIVALVVIYFVECALLRTPCPKPSHGLLQILLQPWGWLSNQG